MNWTQRELRNPTTKIAVLSITEWHVCLRLPNTHQKMRKSMLRQQWKQTAIRTTEISDKPLMGVFGITTKSFFASFKQEVS
jgi:hypothetical protein